MSFWKRLFGGKDTDGEGDAALGPAEEYKGFTIRPAPFKAEGQFQTAGLISKDIAGEMKEHRFIRADRHPSYEDAVSFSLAKARQIIDEQGERCFAERRIPG